MKRKWEYREPIHVLTRFCDISPFLLGLQSAPQFSSRNNNNNKNKVHGYRTKASSTKYALITPRSTVLDEVFSGKLEVIFFKTSRRRK